MTTRLLVGDVRARIAEIPDGSVDLAVTSPPFLALRKYGDNDAEMGSEGTPADFLDALLDLTLEFRRVLAPHGSIAIELGDTYGGSGGGGGDYLPGGLRENQPGFAGSAQSQREGNAQHWRDKNAAGSGWPLAKSLALIPQLYPASLAYGRNLLRQPPSAREMLAISRDFVTRQPDASALALHEHLDAWYQAIDLGPAGQFTPWRVRNIITWCRQNPPVGALGDKVRPATSYITVACPSARRWFDLDAVRTEFKNDYDSIDGPVWNGNANKSEAAGNNKHNGLQQRRQTHAGAPPLDWWDDALDPNDPTDHLTIVMPTQPYPGAHYATWPAKLAQRLIDMMCPLKVCVTCGKPSERIVEAERITDGNFGRAHAAARSETNGRTFASNADTSRTTLGWSDCGHDSWRPGHVLDPFAGSGTTLAVASGMGRDVTGIELYPANAWLIRDRVGMFLEVDGDVAVPEPTALDVLRDHFATIEDTEPL